MALNVYFHLIGYVTSGKNSKCAVSNKHIQDGRPGRYENRRRSKKRQKQTPHPTQEREWPRCHHPEGERIRNCAIWQQKDRVSAEKCQMRPLCPEDEEWCQRPDWSPTLNCNVIGAYPRVLLPFTEYLDDVWSLGLHFSPYSPNTMYFSLTSFWTSEVCRRWQECMLGTYDSFLQACGACPDFESAGTSPRVSNYRSLLWRKKSPPWRPFWEQKLVFRDVVRQRSPA